MSRIGAYEAKTRLSELLDRAEKGEVFEITKNGRPVAKLTPIADTGLAERRAAVARLRARLAREPRVSEEESQRNWERLKAEIEAEDEANDEARWAEWTSSSTRR